MTTHAVHTDTDDDHNVRDDHNVHDDHNDQGADAFDVNAWVSREEQDRLTANELESYDADRRPFTKSERLARAYARIEHVAHERARQAAEAAQRQAARREAARCECCGESGVDSRDFPRPREFGGKDPITVCGRCADAIRHVLVDRDADRLAYAVSYLDRSGIDTMEDVYAREDAERYRGIF